MPRNATILEKCVFWWEKNCKVAKVAVPAVPEIKTQMLNTFLFWDVGKVKFSEGACSLLDFRSCTPNLNLQRNFSWHFHSLSKIPHWCLSRVILRYKYSLKQIAFVKFFILIKSYHTRNSPYPLFDLLNKKGKEEMVQNYDLCVCSTNFERLVTTE